MRRRARLRPVTGYPAAYDWTVGVNHPADDGILEVNIETSRKEVLVSYEDLSNALKSVDRIVTGRALFINDTMWNRDGDRIYFYVRADFETRGRIDTCDGKCDICESWVDKYRRTTRE